MQNDEMQRGAYLEPNECFFDNLKRSISGLTLTQVFVQMLSAAHLMVQWCVPGVQRFDGVLCPTTWFHCGIKTDTHRDTSKTERLRGG